MKGNPHCPACAGTGRTHSQRPQDREPEWRDCDMLPLPGGEAANAAVAADLRRTVEAIAASAAKADKPAE